MPAIPNCTAYRAWLQNRERSPGTIAKYLRDTARFFAETGAPSAPPKAAVAAWRDALAAKGYAPASVNAMLAAVNAYQDFCNNPAGKAKPLKCQRRIFCEARRELSRAEYFRLLDAARRTGRKRTLLVLQTLCATGIRVSELRFITAEAVHKGRAAIRCKGKCREILLPHELCKRLERWCARHDLVMRHTVPVPVQTPELTRAEYLRLLCTARRKGEHRLYLLVKLFATTGLSLQCLGEITVPLVRQGGGTVHHGGETLRIPPGLQDELLEYCGAQHIAVGPVFITSHGQVLNRSNLCRSLQELCRAARVDAHKGNPRALRSLYQATQASIRASLAPLLQKTYDQLLQAEQTTSGWHAGA